MELKTALRLKVDSSLGLVGSGGKTTALFQLAREYAPPVLITASTHLAVQQTTLADNHVVINGIEDIRLVNDIPDPGVLLATGPLDGNRTKGLSQPVLSSLAATCRRRSIPLLVEADGSRGRPLKAPAPYEPPIPAFVDLVVVLAGMSGLDKPLDSTWVHRPERFSYITGISLGESLTPTAVVRALTHPDGGLKNIPAAARRVVILNQADTPGLRAVAVEMTNQLLKEFNAVVVAALNSQGQDHPIELSTDSSPYLVVYEPVAGIILAAGGSSRYGATKQMLDWGGRPLVWHAARKAIEAGLSPVIVVCGSAFPEIQRGLQDLPVKLVYNPGWAEGQGSSVRAGAEALPSESGAVLFILADQPQIPTGLIRNLMEKHAHTRAPIVAPFVAEQRANPVLFDRELFSLLKSLSGEKGGRVLFEQHPVTPVPWKDRNILFDVDTPEDYQRLLTLDP